MNINIGNKPAYSLEQLRDWVASSSFSNEFEAAEKSMVEADAGALSQQATIEAIWRLEGMIVLCWALGLAEIPKYDSLVDVDSILGALYFLDADATNTCVEQAKLRNSDELNTYNEQVLAWHWRIRDFGVRPVAMDYEKMEEECWFGKFDLSWADLVDRDLAIDGVPIASAPEDRVGTVGSAALERHIASNWLSGGDVVYSEVDTAT